jgi:hypothetical protein
MIGEDVKTLKKKKRIRRKIPTDCIWLDYEPAVIGSRSSSSAGDTPALDCGDETRGLWRRFPRRFTTSMIDIFYTISHLLDDTHRLAGEAGRGGVIGARKYECRAQPFAF